MVERIDDMPAGTIGFRASGKVTRDEYRDVLLPPMKEAAEAGEVRMLFVVGPSFEEFEPGALLEDTKAGLGLGARHYSAWNRTAVVTDVEWIQRAIHLLGWMSPGELMVAGIDQLEEAKTWVAA
jgi:hypothetical protein